MIKEKRLGEIEACLARASRLSKSYSSRSGSPSMCDFFSEFVREYKEGENVKVRGVVVPSADARLMIMVKELEGEILSGFSAMIDMLTRRAARKYVVDPEDLAGEGYRGFLNALVHYNGQSRLCNYIHICVKRHLSRACLDYALIRVPRRLRALTMRVVDGMSRSGLSFDEALESEGVSQDKVPEVLVAISKVRNASELDIMESEMASCEDRPAVSGVMKAVELAGLTVLEKAALKGFLDAPADQMGLSKGCAGMVNPVTGRPYSRAAVSSAWKKARKKLVATLKEVA